MIHALPGALRGPGAAGGLDRPGAAGEPDRPDCPPAALPRSGLDTEVERRRVVLAFGGLLVAMFIGALDQTIMATALPTIAGQLGGLSQLP